MLENRCWWDNFCSWFPSKPRRLKVRNGIQKKSNSLRIRSRIRQNFNFHEKVGTQNCYSLISTYYLRISLEVYFLQSYLKLFPEYCVKLWVTGEWRIYTFLRNKGIFFVCHWYAWMDMKKSKSYTYYINSNFLIKLVGIVDVILFITGSKSRK